MLFPLAPETSAGYNFFKMTSRDKSSRNIARLSNALVAARDAIWETEPRSEAEAEAREKANAIEGRLFAAEKNHRDTFVKRRK